MKIVLAQGVGDGILGHQDLTRDLIVVLKELLIDHHQSCLAHGGTGLLDGDGRVGGDVRPVPAGQQSFSAHSGSAGGHQDHVLALVL